MLMGDGVLWVTLIQQVTNRIDPFLEDYTKCFETDWNWINCNLWDQHFQAFLYSTQVLCGILSVTNERALKQIMNKWNRSAI